MKAIRTKVNSLKSKKFKKDPIITNEYFVYELSEEDEPVEESAMHEDCLETEEDLDIKLSREMLDEIDEMEDIPRDLYSDDA